MMERNHGHMVLLASAAGLFGTNGLADYCASKFGVVGFGESMALEIAASRTTDVHYSLICPFFINTGMFDGVSTG
jgi:all-trans-retinol dehydrogenase (NAD+)